MDKKRERIKWAPRIRPQLIKRLYESDALGFQDDELCNDVGFRLFLRCQTIIMVSREEFYRQFSPAFEYKQKILLIDRLIHSFHWSLKENLPARSAANNLIEGDHDQVVEFLDKLAGLDNESKESWRETIQQMMHRRKGK